MIIDAEIMDIKGKELLLRPAVEEDAQTLLDFLQVTCGETRYLAKEPEEITMTLEEEKQFIKNTNSSENSLMLLGFLDGEYVGNCSLMGMQTSRHRHRVSLGIALYQKYTGMGLGRAMLKKLITAAKEMGIEQIELEVVADNERAIRLYQSIGFKIYGTFPNSMKYKDGTYADSYWMMMRL